MSLVRRHPLITFFVLVSLSKPSREVVEADQRAIKMEERLVDVGAPLMADREPAVCNTRK